MKTIENHDSLWFSYDFGHVFSGFPPGFPGPLIFALGRGAPEMAARHRRGTAPRAKTLLARLGFHGKKHGKMMGKWRFNDIHLDIHLPIKMILVFRRLVSSYPILINDPIIPSIFH